MRTATIISNDVTKNDRFDSKFFVDEGHLSFAKVMSGKWPLQSVGKTFGRENIWFPNIFTRVYARGPEYGKPILSPYDLFRYQPKSESYLSKSQVKTYTSLTIKRGWLLITCSGRNLGPLTLIDKFTERFVLSHDMIRVSSGLSDDLFYFLAFLNTLVGQALIRRDRNGSVIDHLNPKQVSQIEYPIVNPLLYQKSVSCFRNAFEFRESARLMLDDIQNRFLKHLSLSPEQVKFTDMERARRFVTNRNAIYDRIDAESYAPLYRAIRDRMIKTIDCCPLSEIADIVKPPGRYKTLYVQDREYGVPALSGRQIAQFRPIGLKIMSEAAWRSAEAYRLKKNMILITADGRAEDNLADCVMVTDERDQWTASGHVHRVLPKEGVHPGLVYLACSTYPAQAQFKSLATGSVVDALSVEDVSSVIVPNARDAITMEYADKAVEAWNLFSKAAKAEDEAIKALEAEFA